jgi:hypothetical protein
MLKIGIKSKYDLNNAGHPAISLHLDGFEAVKFSYLFISKVKIRELLEQITNHNITEHQRNEIVNPCKV